MQIRGKAIVVFEYNKKYLFTVCCDHDKNEVFYIPVGGGIEFGEYSLDAAKREVLEEIGQQTMNERLLGVSENIFHLNGTDEHEIVFIYSAGFQNESAYSSVLKGGINDKGEEIKLIWSSLDEIENNNIRVYPQSLLDILKQKQDH